MGYRDVREYGVASFLGATRSWLLKVTNCAQGDCGCCLRCNCPEVAAAEIDVSDGPEPACMQDAQC